MPKKYTNQLWKQPECNILTELEKVTDISIL